MTNRTAKTELFTVDGISAGAGSPSGGLGTFGRYRLTELLGEGGMGAVYRAYDPQLDREVALKLVTRGKGTGSEPGASSDSWTHRRRERLLREARLAARVRHPSVVAVYETGEIDGRVYMAQELVEGPSLRDLLDTAIPMAPSEAVAIARGIAEALGAVHAAGLIHRDVKPENLLLGADGRVRLTDFGAAREAGPAAKSETGLYVGTPEYSSPEQCVSDDLDGRSDLYSLGVVFFEMLSGTVPHEGESPVELLGKIMSTEAPRLGSLLPGIPPSIDAVVARLLARKRLDRYPDAAALLLDLDTVAGRRTPTTQRRRASRPLPKAAERVSTTRRHRRGGTGRRLARRGLTALIIGAITAATAAAGGAWAWFHGGSDARAEARVPEAPAAPAVLVDAAGGPDASRIGTALRALLRDRTLAPGTSEPLAVTIREFPLSRHVVVELTHDGRRIGRVAYTDAADVVGAVVRDVSGWVDSELARIAPQAPVLPVDLESAPGRNPGAPAHPVDCPGCDDHPDADGTEPASDTGVVPPA